MGQTWSDYECAAKRGPIAIAVKVLLSAIAVGVLISAVGYVFGWCGETASVARDEFGPRASLVKYEWFKDAASQLEKKRADIAVYEVRIDAMNESYKGVPRQQWSRDDREQHSVWMSEVAGTKASFNSLAAEYNSQMAKFNWKFAGSDDLPREFKQYLSK